MAEQAQNLKPIEVDFVAKPSDEVIDESALVGQCEKMFQVSDAARRHYEPVIFGCHAALVGRNGEAFASDITRLRRVHVHTPPGVHISDWANIVQPKMRQGAAKASRLLVRFDADPFSDDPDDVMAARIGDLVLDTYHLINREDHIQPLEIMRALVSGFCCRKTYWDPDAGYDDLRGFGEYGSGDLVSRTVDWFRVWLPPDHDCTTWPPRYIIEAEVWDTDKVQEVFGKEVKPDGISSAWASIDKLLLNVTGQGPTTTIPKRERGVIVKSISRPPSAKRPRGRQIVWANGVLLRDTDLPGGFFNYAPVNWLPIPNRLYASGIIESAAIIQRQYNAALSAVREMARRKMRCDMVIKGDPENGPLVETDEETGAQTIYVPHDSEFKVMDWNVDPSFTKFDMERLLHDLDELTALHPPSMGKSAPGVDTLGEVAVLKDADDTGFGLIIDMLNKYSYALVASHKLRVIRDNVKMPMLMKGLGKISLTGSPYFYGADLGRTTDVVARARPSISPLQAEQLRQKAVEQGLYDWSGGPEQEYGRKLALKQLGIPRIDEEVEEIGTPWETLEQAVTMISQARTRAAVLEAQVLVMQLEEQVMGANQPPDPSQMSAAQIEQLMLQQAVQGG